MSLGGFFKSLFRVGQHAAVEAAHSLLNVLKSDPVQQFFRSALGLIIKDAVAAGQAAKAAGSLASAAVRQQVYSAVVAAAEKDGLQVSESAINLGIELVYNWLKINQ